MADSHIATMTEQTTDHACCVVVVEDEVLVAASWLRRIAYGAAATLLSEQRRVSAVWDAIDTFKVNVSGAVRVFGSALLLKFCLPGFYIWLCGVLSRCSACLFPVLTAPSCYLLQIARAVLCSPFCCGVHVARPTIAATELGDWFDFPAIAASLFGHAIPYQSVAHGGKDGS